MATSARSASRRSTRSTSRTSKTSSSPSPWRSAAIGATRIWWRRRWSTTASCTWPTPGAWSTRSTCAPARGRIVWKMDPGQEKIDRNRGVALWGNLVISVTSHDGRVIATDKETGKIVWDKNLRDQPDMTLNAAPLALEGRDPGRRLGRRPGRAQLAGGARPQDRQRAVADLHRAGARRARQRDLEGQEQRLADRRRRLLRHRLLRPRHQHHLLGLGQPVAEIRFAPTGRATISTPTARSRSTPRAARSAGTTSTRRTTRWTTTRPARTS